METNSSVPEILNLLKKHTSVRKYKNTSIPIDTIKEMLIAAQHAASSNFVQAYSVILVTDENMKKEIGKLSKNEPQINSAPVLLLFCADMKRLEIACKERRVDIQQQTTENFIVSVVDTALFAQNFVIAAEGLGYGICFIGGVRNNPTEIGEIVGLPEKTFPLFGMTVGVPDEEQLVKPRLPIEAILHENKYDFEKYDQILQSYDQTMNEYYLNRKTNQKNQDWTETMSQFLSEKRRLHMKPYLTDKGFLLE